MDRNKLKNPLFRVLRSVRMPALFHDRHWPSRVLDTLETKYHIRPDEMLRLWYIKERVANGKYREDFLFIYDRTKAREKKISVRSSADLYANSGLLLFTGNLFGDGSVRLKKVSNSENN